jgi:hypothetical protein
MIETVPDSVGPQVILNGFPTGMTVPEFGVKTGLEVILNVVGVVKAKAEPEMARRVVKIALKEGILYCVGCCFSGSSILLWE